MVVAMSDNNVWTGPAYKPGESLAIALHCSYFESTKVCMEKWLKGEWMDITFTMMGGIIYPDILHDDRKWIIEQLMITNYVETVMKKSSDADKERLRKEPVVLYRAAQKVATKAARLYGGGLGIRLSIVRRSRCRNRRD
jgi:hypothetical protein